LSPNEPLVLGISPAPLGSRAVRIAKARALKADSALFTINNKNNNIQ